MAGLWDSQRLPKHGMSGKGKSKRRGRSSSLSLLRSRGVLCLIVLLLAAVFYFAVEILVGGLFSVSDNKSSVQNLVTLSSSLPSSSDVVAQSGDGYLNKTAGGSVGVAIVDISMKDLYDRITFENKDGGVWKQGWDVQYKGNEWDKEKLKIFVVPHSHNDPGWIRTVEEYYLERSRHILDTIVQSLVKDPRRKFIWEEMSYLERWWRDAKQTQKEDFIRLVKNGQLEIVGGGWVMNDEANSHYFAIIEQMMTGNMWLLDTVGVAPKNAWAIDPFGHSPTMAYLLGKMGFQNMLIQRTHYEVKKVLALEQNLEFNWRQSWDSLNTTDIFCHMMPFYSYDIPHTCGPEPGVCCQFDYWRSPGRAGNCPWGKQPVEITSANVKERAEMLLDQYRKKSTLYRTNTLLVPLGDDFRYIRVEEAELQFQNYQLLFDYINDHPHLKAKAQFGTLEDYFRTLRFEVKHKTQSKQSSLRAVAGFPALSGDFFTYADREHHYWSGYYVTRPFYKAVDRILEATLRAADIFFTLSHAACRPSDSANFPLNLAESLEAARRDLSLFQHHDGVTGTAKDHVVRDYARRMHTAIVNLENLMASSVGTLLTKSSKIGQCNNLGLNNFEPQHMRTAFNTLPESKALQTKENHFQRVVVYNPLEETIEQVVTIMVDDPAVCVVDSEGESIESQLSPDWGKAIEPTTSSGKHRLQFEVQVPALGLQTYLVTTDHHEGCKPAFLSTLTVFNQPSDFSCPRPYTCVYKKEETPVISNQHQKLEFDSRTGLLTSMRSYSTGKNFKVDEEIAMYSSAGSGAYLFLPSGEAVPIVQPGGLILVTQGPIMQEVHTKPSCLAGYTPLVRSARLFSGSSVQALVAEIEYHVELVEAKFNNKELIARFKTEMNNKQVFHTDLNGFQTIRRETYAKIPLQGNYYPMPSLAFLQCPGGRRFSIHSRQALGVASLKKGELEVMLDRRLTQDDDRGLGQGIMDNEPSRVIFHLLLEFNTSVSVAQSSSPKVPSMLSHRVGAQLSYPLNVFFSKPEPILNLPSTLRTGTLATSYQTLEADLPCDLHVVSLKTPQPKSVSSPMSLNYGILLQRRGWDSAYTAGQDLKCDTTAERSIDLFTMFKHFKISRAQKTSLNFIHDDSNLFGKREYSHRKEGSGSASKLGIVELNPMEIQGFKFDLQALN